MLPLKEGCGLSHRIYVKLQVNPVRIPAVRRHGENIIPYAVSVSLFTVYLSRMKIRWDFLGLPDNYIIRKALVKGK